MDHEKEKILVRRDEKMNRVCIRKATKCDLEAVEKIYDKIHDAEESGKQTTGWIRGVYPVRRTAADAVARGNRDCTDHI